MFGLVLLFVYVFFCPFHLAWGRGSWSLCLSCICLLADNAHINLCHFFSSSWCQGLAAASACGSSWTCLFTFLYFDRLPFNRCLKLLTQIFSQLAFGIKGCSSKTRFISSISRLLCIALWHHVREHIIYTVYSDCVLVFAFTFLSCTKKNLL